MTLEGSTHYKLLRHAGQLVSREKFVELLNDVAGIETLAAMCGCET